MKPQFTLKVCGNVKRKNLSTKAEAAVTRKHTNAKNKQLEDAVQWCRVNNARGKAALNTELFPLIKDRETINRRLDGKIKNGEERSYCSIMTTEEEYSLVRFVKNRNRCM